MKKQDTAAFSLIRCDTEKKMPALAVRAIRAALFFAGLLRYVQINCRCFYIGMSHKFLYGS